MVQQGAVTWTELMTPDLEGAQAFYAAMFGWTFAPVPSSGGAYCMVHAPGAMAPVAGMFRATTPLPGGLRAPVWLSYFAVDDVDERTAAVVAAGGTVLRPPFDVPGIGRVALVAHPAGGIAGWMTRTAA